MRLGSSRRLVGLLAVAFGCSLFTALPARAQDANELTRLRGAFQQAIELEQAGNWSAAVQRFREVGQVRMTPQVRFHIALCEEKLGRLVAALGGYELALTAADTVGTEFRLEVEANVTRLRERIPKLVIKRGAGAEAASIELNSVSVGESSIGVEVPQDPGPHAVTAKAPGYKPFESTVTLEEGQQQTLEIVMEPLPPEPVAPEGPARKKINMVPYIVGGAGAGTLLLSGVFFALRQSTLSGLEDACKDDVCPTSERGAYSRLKTYHYASIVTFGVGAAAVGTAAVMLVLDARKKKQEEQQAATLHLVPTLAPGLAGASALVRF
ncbi:MAG: PEGA domain-containing protein [Polyangiaceae bacterium]